MSLAQNADLEPFLHVPDSLKPNEDLILPALTREVIEELKEKGWARVGILVAFIDSDGNLMMLEHNGGAKNKQGALGPLGETTQYSGPVIEQPLQTLHRGMQEELGIQYPALLGFSMNNGGAWIINQWPIGDGFPGQFGCGISFAVFVPDAAKAHLLSIPHGTEEVNNMHFLPPQQVLGMSDGSLRPGVRGWLNQLDQAELLLPRQNGTMEPIDFSQLFEASLRDIDLSQ